MSKSIETLREAWRTFMVTPKTGDGMLLEHSVIAAVNWLRFEYGQELVLDRKETIALAKKVLCRALGTEFTRAEIEAFLKG